MEPLGNGSPHMLYSARYGSVPSHSRRPFLEFPPPPPYPPPDCEEEAWGNPHQPPLPARYHESESSAPWPSLDEPNEYSYAYYEPGPPTNHSNVLNINSCQVRNDRHIYTTRYGTEENIYEEISEVQHMQSQLSIDQSVVEEEVRRVQSRHQRVLGELNLTVEAMLMPPAQSVEENSQLDAEKGSGPPDLLEDLLLSVGPTDELLSPATTDLDSGFSGSSCMSYQSVKTPGSHGFPGITSLPRTQGTPGFWARKGWIRLPGFGKNEPRLHSASWDESGSGTSSHRRLDHSQRTVSSEESWYSGSEQDISSEDESEKSGMSNAKNNGQLRTTLNKALTLRDKWRSGRQVSEGDVAGSQSRLSRWFSIRRGSAHQYDIEGGNERNFSTGKMPLLPEVEEENSANFSCILQRRQQPPTLPQPPSDITPEQLKRRLIVAAIVHSENSYVAALQRLVNDYKKPLEESSPPILSSSKIQTLFLRLPEILQCHTLFRIALAECVRNWDRDEKIGDVFVASFSKAIVLDIYSEFINNFSVAMDLAKMESKRKSALADFIKVKQISAHDRLSFFGLMVKPVQRFPQFILFLQDLLKHTPQGHHDRMSLQLALTQLESLAEMLNERKREAEQYQAFREMLRHISGKFTPRPKTDGLRYLLREDNVTHLEFNQSGMITKTKKRRLLLLNDLVMCVSVAPRPSDDFNSSERLNLKWSYPVTDIEVVDTSTSPTLSRLLTAGLNRGGSLKSDRSSTSTDTLSNSSTAGVDNICAEMNNLMHDYEVVSRIADLVSSLKGSYPDLTVNGTRKILHSIQSLIQQKDEEMAWVDSCCLQFAVKTKPNKEELFTFQTENPLVKKEWITELRLAQLALDSNNSPAWEIPEQEQRPSTKMPLFVRAQAVYKSQHQSEVCCGCFYPMGSHHSRRQRSCGYLWVCTSDGASSHIAILMQPQQQGSQLRPLASFDLVETKVTAMEFVSGMPDTVWMGTDSRRLLLYGACEPERQEEIGNCTVPAPIVQIKYHCDCVFVALANGCLLQFRRSTDNSWLLREPLTITLGSDPVSSLLPINNSLYAACGKKVWVITPGGEIQKSFSVQHEHRGNVNLMAHSGIGLWISVKNSSTICLYHTETFKHLQDINIASNVMRLTKSSANNAGNCNNKECVNNTRTLVTVTALMACKGLLWVGTNVGISLTIPLPRLEGVPIISGRVNVSHHAHFGPISFLLALHHRMPSATFHKPKLLTDVDPKDDGKNGAEITECLSETKVEKQLSDSPISASITNKVRAQLASSPLVVRRKKSKESNSMLRRASKTLPRGLGSGCGFLSASTSSQGSGDACDVYGLYGELMYVKDYEGDDGGLNGGADPMYESLRRSDPELAAIPGKVSTLDRRLKLKASRPRSLDLSNWSVDSRTSSLYTSSGSEETLPVKLSSQSVSHSSDTSTSNQTRTDDGVSHSTSSTIASSVQGNEKLSRGSSSQSDNSRKTIITLMGGRGYVNWRHTCCSDTKGKSTVQGTEPNSNDAHIVIWEMKL